MTASWLCATQRRRPRLRCARHAVNGKSALLRLPQERQLRGCVQRDGGCPWLIIASVYNATLFVCVWNFVCIRGWGPRILSSSDRPMYCAVHKPRLMRSK
eukprot:8371592-Pyramimonas_sp.AAC.1